MIEFLLKNRYQILGLLVLTIAVYANSLDNGFVSDDIAVLINNPLIGHKEYISYPLGLGRSLYLTLLFNIAHQHASIYRSFNILFHLGTVLLLYQFLTEITKKKVAFVTALIYAVHPILVESVSWISGGVYPQYALLTLLSFFFFRRYLNNQSLPTVLISLILFLSALLMGEKSIILPFLLISYLLTMEKLRAKLKTTLPYFVLSIIWGLLLITQLDKRLASIATSPSPPGTYNPLLQIPIALFSYLKLIFWPNLLTLYQSELRFTQLQYSLMTLTILFFFLLIILAYRKQKLIFLGLSWFVVCLLPTLTPLGISWIVAERYAYLASFGIIFATVVFVSKTCQRLPQELIMTVTLVVVVGLSLRTVTRNQDWQNEDTLWIATAKVSKSSPNAHNNLGDVYTRQGNLPRASQEFARAIELQPTYAEAYHNLANSLSQMGRKEDAIKMYLKALEIKPTLWQAHQNVATIYFDQGNKDEAITHLRAAQKVNPTNSALFTNLGALYLLSGNKVDAEKEYNQALSLNPNDVKAKAGLEKIRSSP